MLAVGDRAPDFTLPDHEGAPFQLSLALRDGPLVLYTYPADFTPGCTRQACSFRDLGAELAHAGLRLVGVSPQSPESHRRFREQYDLDFPLLADERREVIRAYGVDGPFGLVRRGTFHIARDGQILDSLLADLRIARHQRFVEDALRRTGPG